MQPVKRVEVIVEAVEFNKIVALLDQAGITGYTLIRGVYGRGEHGLREGDILSDVLSNVYVLVACPADKVSELVEGIRPLLTKYGGICLVSDAMWVKH